jgi:hypothetical protein
MSLPMMRKKARMPQVSKTFWVVVTTIDVCIYASFKIAWIKQNQVPTNMIAKRAKEPTNKPMAPKIIPINAIGTTRLDFTNEMIPTMIAIKLITTLMHEI